MSSIAATTAATLECSDWAAEALGWCAANNILNKVTPTAANLDATRTEVAQMLANALNR